jgi:DNA-binding Xre family transcriptional regulator
LIKFNLEKTINELDITSNRLAVLAEVRPNTISDLIKGSTKRIELETVEKILEALNYEATRKNKKYYQIQDIVQYESQNPPEAKYGEHFTKESFDLMRNVLSNVKIQSSVSGLEFQNVNQLLVFLEDKIKSGLPISAVASGSYDQIEQTLYFMRNTLITHYLATYTYGADINRLVLTKKGTEYIRLLKKYGYS